MAKGFVVAGAIAIVLGGAAAGYALTRKASGGLTDAQSSAIDGAVKQLDSDITAARSTVHTSASQLSGLITVRAAVVTDAGTVADQVAHGELAFTLDPGLVLELGRVVKATSAVEELMVLPAGAMKVAHAGMVGSYVELVGDQLVITEVARVEPKQDADKLAGFLAVSRPLALAPVVKPLVEAGVAGRVEIGGKSAPIGAMPADATPVAHPLASQKDAQLIVAGSPGQAAMPVPILVGGIGAAVIGVLLLVIGAMGKRPPDDTRAFKAMPTQPTTPPGTPIGHAQTQLSQHHAVASGTPSPVDPGASQVVPGNLGPGSMIGRWEVVRRLGSGGMADVYLAQARGDGGFEKLVAIKVMHGHLARSQRAVDHFLDEARLAARIHHPNVVAIQDLGKIGNDYVIVMEYVEGVDLERVLISARAGERPVPLAVALGILCRICDGLDAAHRATAPDGSPLGMIHRDVKSANVLVSRQGSVKVVDFGIAKAAKQVHFTVAGETKGTPAMMAPEQRVGDQVDVRADVYSVAAVGYELITGHGVNLDLASLAHLGVENWPHLPLPSSLRHGLPAELDEILLHAMAFERERRPADCAALGALCEAVMKHYNLVAGDKDIARWVEGELRLLSPAFVGATTSFTKSPSA
ncbi:MAG: serine/threonine protein kinase [Deltaproteobacteria bacterium]|nr:MAG: serine/threonine protein kinase [Deltaproteobacteria bacterium]